MKNTKFRFAMTFCAAVLIFTGCDTNNKSSDNSKNSDYLKVDKFRIKKEKISPDTWTCHEIRKDKICYPKSWKKIDSEDFYFYADLGDTIQNTFVAVNRYISDSKDITPENYLKEMYSLLLNDTTELLKEYKLYELVFDNKTAYYGEFVTKIAQEEYVFFLMVWAKSNFMYDFGLKARRYEGDMYYKDFQNILYNFNSNGQYVFSEEDELKEFKLISIEEI